MSGPLARSAHMRMKMKREKGGTLRPSPESAPISPARQTVAKELLLAVAVAAAATSSTEEMKVDEVSSEQVPQEKPVSSPTSEVPGARSRIRSLNVRGGINSLETEDDIVVEIAVSPSAAAVARESDTGISVQQHFKPHKRHSPSPVDRPPRQQQQQQQNREQQEQRRQQHHHNSLLPPTPASPPHHSFTDFESRTRQNESYNGNYQLPSTATNFPSRHQRDYDLSNENSKHQQYDVDRIQRLQIERREAIEIVQKKNQETMEGHGRRREHFSGDTSHSSLSGTDDAFDPFAPSPVTVPSERPLSPFFEDAHFQRTDSPRILHHQSARKFEQPQQQSPHRFEQQHPPSQLPQQQQAPRQFEKQHSPRRLPQQQQPPRLLEQHLPPQPHFPQQQLLQQSYLAKSYGGGDQSTRHDRQQHFSRTQPQLFVNTQLPQHHQYNDLTEADDELNVYSPNHKDGSKMMTIEGNDDFVYYDSNNTEYFEQDAIHSPDEHPIDSEEQLDGGADMEYHTNADEGYQHGNEVLPLGDDSVNDSDSNGYVHASSSQTLDSDQALTGTPIRKKETNRPKKKRHSKKEPKFMIENVGSAESLERLKGRSDPRYAIHNSWSHDEEGEDGNEENQIPQKRNVRGHSHKYNEIVATVKRYADIDGRESGAYVLPGKGTSKSQKHEQEQDAENTRKKQALGPVEWQDPENGENEYSDSRKVVLPQRIGMSRSWDSSKLDETRAVTLSKSWDAPSESQYSEGNQHGWRNSSTKKQRNLWDSDEFDEDNNESPLRHRQFIGASKSWDWNNSGSSGAKDNRAFVQWDNASTDWAGGIEKTSGAPFDKAHATQEDEELEKVTIGTVKMPNIKVPYELDTGIEKEQVSDYDDDDSIFAFDKKGQAEDKSPPVPVNPQDIFAKINKGLKQADNAKNRALRGDSMSTVGSDNSENVSEPKSVQCKPAVNKNVAFAKDKDNTIHTYLVEDRHFDSASTHLESNDDEDDREEGGSFNSDEEEESASPRTSPSSASSQGKGKSLSTIDGGVYPRKIKSLASVEMFNKAEQIAHKRKTVRYQSDEDTYHTNDESTFGSSFKSSRSGATVEREKELSLLQHVDIAMTAVAASLGGLLGSPTKANDEKSFDTDQDDNTNGQSTLLSDANTKQSGDWFGYVERVLFPSNEADNVEGERSVVTSNEYSESQYTESLNTESEAKSKYSDLDESNADEDEDEAYLLQQALAAARAVHHIHDVEFDETKEIDVLTDVKFHVVNVKLPLGLLFQEHEIGAWVSRVVPDGNGARKGVQHGDQLAAINGTSAVHASIDEVAATISRTPHNQGVELTFLRYIGPLRPVPGSIVQEGFEVTDKSVNKRKPPPRPPKSQPSPSKTSPKFFKTKSPPSSPKQKPRTNCITENPARSSSSTPNLPTSSSAPSRKMDDMAHTDGGANENSRSNQKKKSVLGKMLLFKKKKESK